MIAVFLWLLSGSVRSLWVVTYHTIQPRLCDTNPVLSCHMTRSTRAGQLSLKVHLGQVLVQIKHLWEFTIKMFVSKKNDLIILLHFWWEYKLIQPLWRTVWRFLEKLEIKPPYDPTIPLLGIYTKENKIEKDTCTPMFIAALFTIARTWKQPRCPSTDEWIKKLWYNGILLCHKKECIWVSPNGVDEPSAYYTEWSKSEREKENHTLMYIYGI